MIDVRNRDFSGIWNGYFNESDTLYIKLDDDIVSFSEENVVSLLIIA